MDAQLSGGTPSVLLEQVGYTLTITLNRPEARNAVDLGVAHAVGDAMEDADRDPAVRVVVITGAGDRAFCAGADLKSLARGEWVTPREGVRGTWGFAGYVGHTISKPTIAAVNGYALGGGTEIALASDLVIAARHATFGLPEVKRGIYAGAGGAFRLPRQVPRKVAMQMIFTGEPVSAERACDLHLVNEVVPEGEALGRALELAEQISANAPLAVQASKRVALGLINGVAESEASLWRLSREEGERLFQSEDAREGTRAFVEKRAPVWRAQ